MLNNGMALLYGTALHHSVVLTNGVAFYNGMALYNDMTLKQWCNDNNMVLTKDQIKVSKGVNGYNFIVR